MQGDRRRRPIVNRAVGRVLRSPLRRWAGRGLVEVTYRTRSSGALVRFPAQYARVGSDVLVLPGHPERKRWWRTFRQPTHAVLRLPEGERAVIGRVVDEPDRAECLASYLRRFPSARRAVGLDKGFTLADLADAAGRTVLVKFRLVEADGSWSG
jgi:hypothetical protein